MKKVGIVAFCVSLLLLTGCSFLNREYSSVASHNAAYYESEDRSILRAEGYQDLVNDLLLMASSGTEEGTIRFYADEQVTDVKTTIEEACHEAQFETPWGSYAVDYITYTTQDDASASVIHVEIGYRRTLEQRNAVVHTSSISALHNLLSAAVENGAKELVLQVSYFQGQTEEVTEIVEQIRQEKGISEPWQVNYYPDEIDAGIIEILLEE